MCSLMWYMSLLVLLTVDVRTGALQHQDASVHECHACVPDNNTTCEQSSEWTSAICPASSPFCATIAIAPNFRSSLACSAALNSSCSLTYSSQNTLLLNCICSEYLCNVPFPNKLRNELLKFSPMNITSIKLVKTFFKMIFTNITDVDLYKRITVNVSASHKLIENSSQSTTSASVPTISKNSYSLTRQTEFHPRLEALKEKSTVPSDDDEDENEGSGSYEESKSHSQLASAPAAPSSFLPADENNSATLIYNFYLITYLIVHIIT